MTSKKQKQAGFSLPETIEPGTLKHICVTFPDTDEYTRAFYGAVTSLCKWWNWEKSYNAGDERAKEAAELWRNELLFSVVDSCEGGGDMPVQLRENPSDACLIEQSFDDGVTWHYAWRKDNCGGTTTNYSPQQIVNDITNITNNNITYAGDIINIAPKWGYTPGITDLALCYAVKTYVDLVCDFHLTQLKDNNTLLDISHFAQSIATLLLPPLVAVAAGTGQYYAAAAGAVAYAMAEEGFRLINEALSNDRSFYEDTAAREVVACWMFTKIKGATPQFAEWGSSLDDFRSDDEIQNAIAKIVSIANSSEDLYVNYLLTLQDLSDMTASLPSCNCPEPTIIEQLSGEFKNEFFGNQYTNPSGLAISNPADTPVVGAGVYYVPTDLYYGVTGSIGGIACNIRVNLPENSLITVLKVGWGITRPSVFGGGDKNAAMFAGDEGNPMAVYLGGHSWPGGTYGYQDIVSQVSNPLGLTPTPHPYLYVHNSCNTGSAYVDIWWIYIETIPYIP
jgi:hypothetical protein